MPRETMTPKERWSAVLKRKRPDRIPMDYWGTPEITLALQEQAAAFIASDGEQINQPLPAHYFEVPIQGPLPETLNYIR